MILRQMKARLSAILLAFAAVLFFGPGGALAEMEILNNGYPYGMNMTSSSITLVIESNNPSASYQWQVASSKDETFADITGETGSTYTFQPNKDTDSGKWYRCKVNDKYSNAVMIVYPGKDNRTWTQPFYYYGDSASDYSWYISNGTIAYMMGYETNFYSNPCIINCFDVVGLYDNQMLQTSYNDGWQVFSSTESNPASIGYYGEGSNDYQFYFGGILGKRPTAVLRAMRVSFHPYDPYALNFEVDLGENQHAFTLGCDTKIGDIDSAALRATMTGSDLSQIEMLGTRSLSNSTVDLANVASFVVKPVTPCSQFWIGQYSQRKHYAYAKMNNDIVKLVDDTDSGMTMSWTGLPEGAKIQFQFRVGTAASTGAIVTSIDFSDGTIKDLLENTVYQITTDLGRTHDLTSDSNGTIPLEQTGSHDFYGRFLTIQNSAGQKREVRIPDRPITTPLDNSDIRVSSDAIEFSAADGQEYEYSVDGSTWQTLPVGADGNCKISGLQSNSNFIIRTRKPATANSFASAWTKTSVSITRAPIQPSVTMADWVFGGEPSKPVVTGNPGNGAVTIEYKLREDDVTSYRPEVPTQPGEYTVRVLIAETANYQGGQASAHFSILLGTDTLPRTGDGSRPALWLGLLALSGAGLAALLLRRRKS